MNDCQKQCTREGYPLKRCMCLADFKFDWEGNLVLLPVPVRAGSSFGIFHCCCNYPEPSPEENAVRRKEWEKFRESYREGWSEKFGQWPAEDDVSWPGNHIRDLKSGGNPVDPSNIFPAKPSVHDIYNRAYPACYGGQPPWNSVGPDLPYTDWHEEIEEFERRVGWKLDSDLRAFYLHSNGAELIERLPNTPYRILPLSMIVQARMVIYGEDDDQWGPASVYAI